MTTIDIGNAVCGSGRAAASARLLAVTSRPWLAGSPAPAQARMPFMAYLPVRTIRSFDTTRQGSPDLRPPA